MGRLTPVQAAKFREDLEGLKILDRTRVNPWEIFCGIALPRVKGVLQVELAALSLSAPSGWCGLGPTLSVNAAELGFWSVAGRDADRGQTGAR